jgi:hypothetical protein
MPTTARWSNVFVHALGRLRQYAQGRAVRAAAERDLRRDVLRLAVPATGEQTLRIMISMVS